jgi:hypothetical protein
MASCSASWTVVRLCVLQLLVLAAVAAAVRGQESGSGCNTYYYTPNGTAPPSADNLAFDSWGSNNSWLYTEPLTILSAVNGATGVAIYPTASTNNNGGVLTIVGGLYAQGSDANRTLTLVAQSTTVQATEWTQYGSAYPAVPLLLPFPTPAPTVAAGSYVVAFWYTWQGAATQQVTLWGYSGLPTCTQYQLGNATGQLNISFSSTDGRLPTSIATVQKTTFTFTPGLLVSVVVPAAYCPSSSSSSSSSSTGYNAATTTSAAASLPAVAAVAFVALLATLLA